jgi:hypothetical protein
MTELSAVVTAQKRRKLIAPRSGIWVHFKKNAGAKTVTCVYCKKTYEQPDSSTTKFWRHIKTAHRDQLKQDQTIEQVLTNSVPARSIDYLVDLVCGALLPFSHIEGNLSIIMIIIVIYNFTCRFCIQTIRYTNKSNISYNSFQSS